MNKQNTFNQCKPSHIMWLIVSLLMASGFNQVQAQTFELQSREYIQVDGQWYLSADGIIGDQVIPERIVIQLRPDMEITQLDSSSLNLSDLQVISAPIAENFHVFKFPSNLDPFISAAALSNITEVLNIEFDALGEWTSTS